MQVRRPLAACGLIPRHHRQFFSPANTEIPLSGERRVYLVVQSKGILRNQIPTQYTSDLEVSAPPSSGRHKLAGLRWVLCRLPWSWLSCSDPHYQQRKPRASQSPTAAGEGARTWDNTLDFRLRKFCLLLASCTQDSAA